MGFVIRMTLYLWMLKAHREDHQPIAQVRLAKTSPTCGHLTSILTRYTCLSRSYDGTMRMLFTR